LLIDSRGYHYKNGTDYSNESAFWYTSGTTGDSKFYSFTQQQLDHVSQTIVDSYRLTSNDRYLSIMPLWHAHGLGMYWATKLAKCEVKFIKVHHLRTTVDFDPTFLSAIPDFLKIMMRQNFKNLRFARSASSALPLHLYTHLKEKFKIPIIEAFGMTEAGSHCFTNPLDGEQRPGTIGLPSGIEASIDTGRLYIKGPGVCQSDWLDTGDLAEQDSAGYYKILGRVNDRLNIKGYKIDPLSIEHQLYEHFPMLEQVYIFGTDRLKCVYVGQCDSQELRQWLIDLDIRCNPTLLEKLELIPVNDAGKVSRTLLDKLF
jgi:long-subunit acyl-CoA synthetase (AMP-forming)